MNMMTKRVVLFSLTITLLLQGCNGKGGVTYTTPATPANSLRMAHAILDVGMPIEVSGTNWFRSNDKKNISHYFKLFKPGGGGEVKFSYLTKSVWDDTGIVSNEEIVGEHDDMITANIVSDGSGGSSLYLFGSNDHHEYVVVGDSNDVEYLGAGELQVNLHPVQKRILIPLPRGYAWDDVWMSIQTQTDNKATSFGYGVNRSSGEVAVWLDRDKKYYATIRDNNGNVLKTVAIDPLVNPRVVEITSVPGDPVYAPPVTSDIPAGTYMLDYALACGIEQLNLSSGGNVRVENSLSQYCGDDGSATVYIIDAQEGWLDIDLVNTLGGNIFYHTDVYQYVEGEELKLAASSSGLDATHITLGNAGELYGKIAIVVSASEVNFEAHELMVQRYSPKE